MYDLYPDWGPAHLRAEWHRDDPDPASDPQDRSDPRGPALASVQAGLDLRDNGGERPDDN